jgi:hypothetical protein
MNSAALASSNVPARILRNSRKPVASCIRNHNLGGSLTAEDCKYLNKVAALLVKFGAASVERLAKVSKLQTCTVQWALFQLDAECGSAELHYLPGEDD